MSFKVTGWLGMQKQSQVAISGAFGTQKPIESKLSVREGIDLKLWLFEELLAFIYFQLNAFANC
jgi:hypothetical protein